MDILEGIPSTFSQRPKTKTMDEGTDVELECQLVAVPEPDVAWFHNGKRINPSDRIAPQGQSDVHMYGSIIQIRDVCMTDVRHHRRQPGRRGRQSRRLQRPSQRRQEDGATD